MATVIELCATPTDPCYDPTPICFDIEPPPYVDDPPNITVCAGEQTQVDFTGGPGDQTYTWTVWNAYNPFGLPPSGSGDLDFIAIHDWFFDVPVGGTVSVHPFEDGCEGISELFAIAVLPHPEMDPPPDLTVCAGAPVSVVFSGPAGTTYTWENSNTAVGLAAAGTGNINFSAAQVTQTEVAAVSVTPVKAGCEGLPIEFQITVNPGPMLDDPPDITVCAGEPVSVTFNGTGTGFSWTNSNPAIGLAAGGTGNINFTAAAVTAVQTATVTVTPTGGTCPGQPETFTISVLPRPVLNPVANVTACVGSSVTVNFGGTSGAGFEWTNSNPAVGLGVSGTGNLSFTAADVSGVQTATVTVTPVKDGCPGQPKTFQITVKPLPFMDAPPDWSGCAETEFSIGFNGTAGAIFGWTNSNPAVGLGPSGSGDISFTATNWPTAQTAEITVTPTLAGCAGQSYSFNIIVLPAPVMSPLPDVSVCEEEQVLVVFSGTNGASYSWTNSNPAIGLPSAGSGPLLNFAAADVTGTQIGTITVTPQKGGCAGQPVSFEVTVVNCCATDAGSLDTNSVTVCGPKTVGIVHFGNQNLEPNDTLRFVLFSNLANPMGSIVQYSDTLFFPFLPGIMDFDSTYYAAAIAGNLLGNDSIDTADPCFSLRPGPKIRWHKIPTIAVSSPPDSVCGIGCVNVQFDFTGAPPFQFTWEISQGGQVLFAKTESVGGFQLVVMVCPEDFDLPAADGYFQFQVNYFVDKFCGCGD